MMQIGSLIERIDKSKKRKNGKAPAEGLFQRVAKRREEEQLTAAENKLTAEDIEFVINTIKKEAQYDELSIRQLLYGMSSAFTKMPISHTCNSKESGAGKSYLLNLVSSYFSKQIRNCIIRHVAKALFHRRGYLVISE